MEDKTIDSVMDALDPKAWVFCIESYRMIPKGKRKRRDGWAAKIIASGSNEYLGYGFTREEAVRNACTAPPLKAGTSMYSEGGHYYEGRYPDGARG